VFFVYFVVKIRIGESAQTRGAKKRKRLRRIGFAFLRLFAAMDFRLPAVHGSEKYF
jgi:hypothetical protein